MGVRLLRRERIQEKWIPVFLTETRDKSKSESGMSIQPKFNPLLCVPFWERGKMRTPLQRIVLGGLILALAGAPVCAEPLDFMVEDTIDGPAADFYTRSLWAGLPGMTQRRGLALATCDRTLDFEEPPYRIIRARQKLMGPEMSVAGFGKEPARVTQVDDDTIVVSFDGRDNVYVRCVRPGSEPAQPAAAEAAPPPGTNPTATDEPGPNPPAANAEPGPSQGPAPYSEGTGAAPAPAYPEGKASTPPIANEQQAPKTP
jgi:hypothetical protein